MDNDITLWLILPPLFFALGWASARLDIRYLMEESAKLPRHYFDALRAILNHRLDTATLTLTDVLKRQPDAAPLQLALGDLHRRQGQFQEAVYFHEQLQQSPIVSPLVREEAALALARDYLSAGLWDRAETAFLQLKDHAVYGNEARACLVEIFECSAQWMRAIEHRREWADRAMRSDAHVLAHYYCEQVVLYFSQTHVEDKIKEALDQALLQHPHSIRALMLQAEWATTQRRFEEARQICLDIETHQPEAIVLVLPLLHRIDEALSMHAATYQWLKAAYDRHHLPALLVPISEGAQRYDSYPQSVLRWIFDALAEYPSPSLLKSFVQLKIATSVDAKANSEDATLVMHVLQGYSKRYEVYRCKTCGFVAHRHHWQCPACRTWEPFPMIPEVRA